MPHIETVAYCKTSFQYLEFQQALQNVFIKILAYVSKAKFSLSEEYLHYLMRRAAGHFMAQLSFQ